MNRKPLIKKWKQMMVCEVRRRRQQRRVWGDIRIYFWVWISCFRGVALHSESPSFQINMVWSWHMKIIQSVIKTCLISVLCFVFYSVQKIRSLRLSLWKLVGWAIYSLRISSYFKARRIEGSISFPLKLLETKMKVIMKMNKIINK